MAITTVVFRPNSLTTDIAYAGAGTGFKRATWGGVSRQVILGIITFRSNESDLDPWNGNVTRSNVAASFGIAQTINYRARTMMRFVLRAQTIDAPSIVSGPTPLATWWPFVVGARLKWRNGDPAGLQNVQNPIHESSLLVRVGRTLYTPTGANEEPFGRDTGGELSPTFTAAQNFGSAEATLPWSTWAQPDRSDKVLALSASAISTWLQTITGASNDYLDFSFRLADELVDGIDINRELAAWEPFPPTLEIDFNIERFMDLASVPMLITPRALSFEAASPSGLIAHVSRRIEVAHEDRFAEVRRN